MGNKSRFYANIEAMHDEVTGSCILVTVSFPNSETLRFIVDCGLYQEREYEKLNESLNVNVETSTPSANWKYNINVVSAFNERFEPARLPIASLDCSPRLCSAMDSAVTDDKSFSAAVKSAFARFVGSYPKYSCAYPP